MNIRLQHFDHDKSPYERPNQKWVCGWAVDGEACHRGPDNHGRCHGKSECTPQRRGDRWHCMRAASCGGECQQGPMPDGKCSRPITPCQPVRSLRSKRAMIVWGVSGVSFGMLLVLGLGPWNREFLSPGQLSTAHGINDQQCSVCHVDTQHNQAFFDSPAIEGSLLKSDSQRCLQCHQIPQFADLAHNLPPESLHQVSDDATQDQEAENHTPLRMWAARQLPGNDNLGTRAYACATCHNEHRGRNADIAFMDNARCQSCHKNQFKSFANGHLEFGSDYPFVKRSGIAFNHVTHLNNYFREQKYTDTSPADCSTCHVPDVAGRRMQTLDFNSSCASCHHHADEIQGAGLTEPSIAFLRLPSVAISILEKHSTWLGEDPWPADAFDDDREMTSFMLLLLEVDKDVAEDLNILRKSGLSLADLSSADETEVQAAGRLVWAIKRLLYDLLQGGQPELESRLVKALGDKVVAQQLAAMSGFAPDNTTTGILANQTQWQSKLRVAQELWLPNLMTDVQRYVSGERTPSNTIAHSKGDEAVVAEAVSKGIDNDAVPDEDDLLDDDDLLLDDDEQESDLQDEELLGEEDLLEDVQEALDDDLLDDDEPVDAPTSTADKVLATELVRMRSLLNEFSSVGKWHIDESDFSIRYRPTGHADTFLKAWLDVTADARSTAVPLSTMAIFDELRRETNQQKSPGRCTKCHSVDSVGGDSLRHVINWRATGGLPADRRLTTFTHSPHMNLAALRDCTSCHTLSSEADDARQWKAMYLGSDPMQGRHSFDPINKSNCSQCHLTDNAGDNCLSCHNYHAGFASRASLSTVK